MEIRVLEEEPTRRVLELTVPREEVERHLDRVAGQLQQRATLPGFRKGRVPRRLLEARFGSSLEQEALEGAVEEAYAKAVREQALEPVSMPAIDEVRFVPGEPLRFRATLEVRPTVEVDKGRGVRRLLRDAEFDAGVYVGDDTTDLDAFRALGGLEVGIRVAVASAEAPPGLRDAADVVVAAPEDVLAILRGL